MAHSLLVQQSLTDRGELTVHIGHELADDYLIFLAGRARPNTVLATAFDLKVFLSWTAKEPSKITTRDIVNFIAAQRAPRVTSKVVRISDGGSGLSTRTIARRLSSISGFFAYLIVKGDTGVITSPVPRGLINRRARRNGGRATPLVRTPKLLPRILQPQEVDTLMSGLLTVRDRAMAEAMVLGGLRRCEVLNLRLGDLQVAERKVFIADGKGGRQRVVPISNRFFSSVASYLDDERPKDATTDHVFLVMKGPRRGQPLSAYGLDRILERAKERTGLAHGTCHELRHTCLTRLREAGMALEAVQAQAGHASVETTRLWVCRGSG
jgi:integrase/recombinase XerD